MNCATWRGNQDQDQLDMTAHGSQRTRHTAHIMYAKVRSRGSILPPKSHETELTGRSQPTYNLPTSRDPPPEQILKINHGTSAFSYSRRITAAAEAAEPITHVPFSFLSLQYDVQ